MENDSVSGMWRELKASKPKMIFFSILVVIGTIGLVRQGIKIAEPPPVLSISYDALMKEIYLSGKTSAQKDYSKNEYFGKRVSWRGTVTDVKKFRDEYEVELSDGDKRALTDFVAQGLSASTALSLSEGQTVRVTGTIDRISDGMLTGYVYLSDAEIK